MTDERETSESDYKSCVITVMAHTNPATDELSQAQWERSMNEALEYVWNEAMGGGTESDGSMWGAMPQAVISEVHGDGNSASAKVNATLAGETEADIARHVESFFSSVVLDWHPNPRVEEDGGGVGLDLQWSLASVSEV